MIDYYDAVNYDAVNACTYLDHEIWSSHEI